MPYTPEELNNLPFYQKLVNADERAYLRKKEALQATANISGSANRGAVVRDKSDTILLFEDPYKNELLEDQSSLIVHNLRVRKLKTTDDIDEVVERNFREL
tara:strand:+ start:68 stop:370 length:303 start_codon:yes stop_codon:yes gene_type:complete